MSRLDEIQKRVDARMADLERKLNARLTGAEQAGADTPPRADEDVFAASPVFAVHEIKRETVARFSEADLARLAGKVEFYLMALRPHADLPNVPASESFRTLSETLAHAAANENITLGFCQADVLAERKGCKIRVYRFARLFTERTPPETGVPLVVERESQRPLRLAAETAAYFGQAWRSYHVTGVAVSWQWLDACIDTVEKTVRFAKPRNAMCSTVPGSANACVVLMFDPDFVSPEVVAHEYTHGVTQNRICWSVYKGETGAVNESFSDIFAKFSCWAWQGREADKCARWRIAGMRDMAHPESLPQPGGRLPPSYYLQKPRLDNPKSGWYRGFEDNGGVHINNGVLTRLCYLLCEGESFTRDDGRKFRVEPIGFERTEQLFGAVVFGQYLGSTITSFYAVAEAFQAAAQDLAFTPPELESLTAACDAVNILPPPDENPAIRRFKGEIKMEGLKKTWWRGAKPLADVLAETFRRELGLDAPGAGFAIVGDEAVEPDARGAGNGTRTVTLQQTYHDIPVFGATARARVRGGDTLTYVSRGFSGALASVRGGDRIGRDKACEIAREDDRDLDIAHVGQVVWDPALFGRPGSPVLAWHVETARERLAEKQFIIDAATGEILDSAPLRIC